MNYYLDTEFDGDYLLSLALVGDNSRSFYAVIEHDLVTTDWVTKNVMPILHSVPELLIDHYHKSIRRHKLPNALNDFLMGEMNPHIYVDWPTDIAHLCKALITGPGTMIGLPAITFTLVRVDAYPTVVPGAVQHNAWWDAVALRAKITGLGPTNDLA